MTRNVGIIADEADQADYSIGSSHVLVVVLVHEPGTPFFCAVIGLIRFIRSDPDTPRRWGQPERPL
jgi:hypothetical protein